nr:S24 family peptidase [Fusicatenibacter saccharivorans]
MTFPLYRPSFLFYLVCTPCTPMFAWIQKKDSLANGEIGIFYLNGNIYIKELHDEPDGVYLISLNQKYRPIQVLESDSFKVFGKVIGKCKGAEIPGFH